MTDLPEDNMASVAAPDASPSGQLLPSVILARAADLIEPEGAWLNDGGWYSKDAPSIKHATCFCAEGAIARAGGYPLPIVYQTNEAGYLCRVVGVANIGIPDWNDDKRRTQPEVVKALRDASELARSEGQ